MQECKLCHVEVAEEQLSSADRKMCKTCYTALTKYKRWQTTGLALETWQMSDSSKLEAMFDYNASIRGYVPACYKNNKREISCATCSKLIKTSTNIKYCSECRSREISYIQLLARNPGSKSVGQYEAFYDEARSLGRKVPVAYLRRYPNGSKD